LFGLGNEEEDAEEDELSLDETSEGLREDERDRVPMAEAKKKKEIWGCILWTYIEFECVIQGMGGGHLIFGSATNEFKR
jgi:hypothetical protein